MKEAWPGMKRSRMTPIAFSISTALGSSVVAFSSAIALVALALRASMLASSLAIWLGSVMTSTFSMLRVASFTSALMVLATTVLG